MKTRIFAAVLAAVTAIFALSACTPEDNIPDTSWHSQTPESQFTSILTDKKFKRGFTVRGLGIPIYPEHAEEETYGDEMYDPGYVFDYGGKTEDVPVWQICQWSSRYAFHDPSVTTFTESGSTYTYENKSKLLRVDTSTGEFTLGLKGSECYVYGDRKHGQEWPHLLISRDINRNYLTKISDKKEIRILLDGTLDDYRDKMTIEPYEHAAQCMFYLYIANYDEASRSFSDMLWLGMSLFDNRTPYAEELARGDVDSKESETGKYIYNIAAENYLWDKNNFYKNGKISLGSRVHIDFDIFPFIKQAFERAQADGYMLTSSYENLYVNGMYIGFELPGTYDLQMTFKNMDIKVF